jgi:hypothetical protein
LEYAIFSSARFGEDAACVAGHVEREAADEARMAARNSHPFIALMRQARVVASA